jgi:hypothetical protein
LHDAWAPYDGYPGADHQLARRLLGRQEDYPRFTQHFAVPPDNNGCERDIRMAKLRQKVSGCMRTLTGARLFQDRSKASAGHSRAADVVS